jgi:hypothetical protein
MKLLSIPFPRGMGIWKVGDALTRIDSGISQDARKNRAGIVSAAIIPYTPVLQFIITLLISWN